MRTNVLIVTGLLLTGSVALAARPGGQGPRGERGDQGRRGRAHAAMMIRELGLTDSQVSQIQKMRSDERKAAIRRRADMQVARLELRELVEGATVDEKAVAAKVKELSDLQAAALKARVDARLAFRKALTPEQVQKLRDLKLRGPQRPGHGGDGPGRRSELDGDEADDQPEEPADQE